MNIVAAIYRSLFAEKSHTHNKSEVTDFSHTHESDDVTDLQLKLDSKSDIGHQHVKSEISDFNHIHVKSNITDFDHTHSIGNIDGLQMALDSKSNTGHTHTKQDITGLTTDVVFPDYSNPIQLFPTNDSGTLYCPVEGVTVPNNGFLWLNSYFVSGHGKIAIKVNGDLCCFVGSDGESGNIIIPLKKGDIVTTSNYGADRSWTEDEICYFQNAQFYKLVN